MCSFSQIILSFRNRILTKLGGGYVRLEDFYLAGNLLSSFFNTGVAKP